MRLPAGRQGLRHGKKLIQKDEKKRVIGTGFHIARQI